MTINLKVYDIFMILFQYINACTWLILALTACGNVFDFRFMMYGIHDGLLNKIFNLYIEIYSIQSWEPYLQQQFTETNRC